MMHVVFPQQISMLRSLITIIIGWIANPKKTYGSPGLWHKNCTTISSTQQNSCVGAPSGIWQTVVNMLLSNLIQLYLNICVIYSQPSYKKWSTRLPSPPFNLIISGRLWLGARNTVWGINVFGILWKQNYIPVVRSVSTSFLFESKMKHLCDLTFFKGHTIRECIQCWLIFISGWLLVSVNRICVQYLWKAF